MRAVYQLNQEKLDYNCSVLGERENENSSTISQQKRRLSCFQSTLSALKVMQVLHRLCFAQLGVLIVWVVCRGGMLRSSRSSKRKIRDSRTITDK